MKLLKMVACHLLLIPLLLSACGCTLIRGKMQLEIKDTNGEEDFSLSTLTEKEICAESNESYCAVYGFTPSGASSYEEEDEIWHDADTVEAFAETPLSGVALLQMTYGKEDVILFTVECNRTSGNLRIVLLDESLNIVHDFDVSEKSTYRLSGAKDKSYEIRIAGESAEFEIKVSREFAS